MLHIKFEITEHTIFKVNRYFDLNYKKEWIQNPLVKEIIKDIDESAVIGESVAIDSPLRGIISPRDLTSSVKTLILMIFQPNNEYYGGISTNCNKWIHEISKLHDIHIAIENIMEFPNVDNLNIHIVDSNKVVNTMQEYVTEHTKFIELGGGQS